MSIHLTFVKKKRGDGTRILGELTWLADSYQVITGGYGKVPISISAVQY